MPERPKKYVLSNGVRSNSNDLEGWQFRGERWIEDNTGHKADTYHYTVPGLFAWRVRDEHVKRLGLCLSDSTLQGKRDVVFVGHSWATDLFCRAMEKYPGLYVHSAHLIGGAAQESFKANKLNDALREGRLGYVVVYFNPGDPVLLRHRYWKYLGYGKLGLKGPTHVDPLVADRVKLEPCLGVGHSGYFAGDNFVRMMQMVTAELPLTPAAIDVGPTPAPLAPLDAQDVAKMESEGAPLNRGE